MLAGIVILLNQKNYFVNVYARISLNRSFSDTIFQLMWDTKKSENILMCVRSPSTPPWTRPRYQYVLGRTQKVGYMYYDISFQK